MPNSGGLVIDSFQNGHSDINLHLVCRAGCGCVGVEISDPCGCRTSGISIHRPSANQIK